MTRLRFRRTVRVDGARWALVAVLGFAAFTKVVAYALGVRILPLANVAPAIQAAVAWLVGTSLALELALVTILALATAPRRRVLPGVATLAGAWTVGLLVMLAAGIDASRCGCLGPSTPLLPGDHALITGGVLLLAASQARRLTAVPWSWFSARGAEHRSFPHRTASPD